MGTLEVQETRAFVNWGHETLCSLLLATENAELGLGSVYALWGAAQLQTQGGFWGSAMLLPVSPALDVASCTSFWKILWWQLCLILPFLFPLCCDVPSLSPPLHTRVPMEALCWSSWVPCTCSRGRFSCLGTPSLCSSRSTATKLQAHRPSGLIPGSSLSMTKTDLFTLPSKLVPSTS